MTQHLFLLERMMIRLFLPRLPVLGRDRGRSLKVSMDSNQYSIARVRRLESRCASSLKKGGRPLQTNWVSHVINCTYVEREPGQMRSISIVRFLT